MDSQWNQRLSIHRYIDSPVSGYIDSQCIWIHWPSMYLDTLTFNDPQCKDTWTLHVINDSQYIDTLTLQYLDTLTLKASGYIDPQCIWIHWLSMYLDTWTLMQQITTRCNTIDMIFSLASVWVDWGKIEGVTTHCSALQHTAAHCNTLQRTATHCNTL